MLDLKSQFIAWLDTKPADEEYRYFDTRWVGGDNRGCAIIQFCKAHGLPVEAYLALDEGLIAEAAIDRPQTFGALRSRLQGY